MPPFEMITRGNLKGILQGEKKLLKMKEVNFCNVPAFDEIGVKAIYDKVVKMEGMAAYFPSSYPKGRICSRQYMYDVWNTIHPEQVAAALKTAR